MSIKIICSSQKAVLLGVVLYFCAAPLANACFDGGRELTKQEALTALVDAIYIDKLSISAAHSVIQQGVSVHKIKLSYSQENLIQKKMESILKDRLRAPGGARDRAIAIYGGVFNENEVCDILHFYRSPTGQKYSGHIEDIGNSLSTSIDASYAEKKLLLNIDDELVAAFREQGVKVEK